MIENIESQLEKIFDGSYLPLLVKRELIAYIIDHRIDELIPTEPYENPHGAQYVIRSDGTRDVSKSERLIQLQSLADKVRSKQL